MVWQWWNFHKASVAEGKRVLRVNCDETSVALFQGDGKGNVFFSKKRRLPQTEPVQRVTRAKMRGAFTHLAFVCDRSDIQPLLPQVIIGNSVFLKARGFAELRSNAPRNVYLVRQRSAWNNAHLFVEIIKLLMLILAPFRNEFQVVLLFDAAKCHCHATVFRACHELGVWPLLCPAKLTWLLQPCDTHAFQQYKVTLRQLYQEARVQAGTPDIGTSAFLKVMYDTIRIVLQGTCWEVAFAEDGYGETQSDVTKYILEHLEVETPPVLPATMPDLKQVELLFPCNAKGPAKSAMPPAPKAAPALPMLPPPPMAAPALPPPPAPPISLAHRLRSKTRLALAAGSVPAAPSVAASETPPPAQAEASAAPEAMASLPAAESGASRGQDSRLGAVFDNLPADVMTAQIQELRVRRREIQQSKAAVTKQLKNQAKRAKRLKQKAARLSNTDLIDVLTMRHNGNRAASSRDTPMVAAEDPSIGPTSSPPPSEEVGAE